MDLAETKAQEDQLPDRLLKWNAGLSALPAKPGVFGYGFIPPGLFARRKSSE